MNLSELIKKLKENITTVATVGIVLLVILPCVVFIATMAHPHQEYTFITPTPSPIVNASIPTPTPSPIANASIGNGSNSTPSVIVAPVPWHGEDYDQYIRDLEKFYNVSETPRENRTFPDPLDYRTIQMLMNNGTMPQNPSYIEGHPETATGYLIYHEPSPTPTPAPVDDPFRREVHWLQMQNEFLPDLQHYDSTINEFVTITDTRGIYSYYHNDPYKKDYLVLQLEFMNTYWNPIVNPTINLHISTPYTDSMTGQEKFTDVFDKNYTWPVTIPAAKWDYDHQHLLESAPIYTYTNEIGYLDESYPHTTYMMKITMYYDNVAACSFTKTITLL